MVLLEEVESRLDLLVLRDMDGLITQPAHYTRSSSGMKDLKDIHFKLRILPKTGYPGV